MTAIKTVFRSLADTFKAVLSRDRRNDTNEAYAELRQLHPGRRKA